MKNFDKYKGAYPWVDEIIKVVEDLRIENQTLKEKITELLEALDIRKETDDE